MPLPRVLRIDLLELRDIVSFCCAGIQSMIDRRAT
jgi:hypothetical protein